MHAASERRLWLLAPALAIPFWLAACSSVTDRTRDALTAATPYRVEVVQGNFVSKEQVDALKAGMSRQQAREILGTPLLSDVFHGERWDYVFTIRRQGVEPLQRRLTLTFDGEQLQRVAGDEMPSEQDFVAALDTRKRSHAKVPELVASEEALQRFPPAQASAATAASTAPLPTSYPPLEAKR